MKQRTLARTPFAVCAWCVVVWSCAQGDAEHPAGPSSDPHRGHRAPNAPTQVERDALSDLQLLVDMGGESTHITHARLLASDGQQRAVAELRGPIESVTLANVVTGAEMELEYWLQTDPALTPVTRGFRLPLPAAGPYTLSLDGSGPEVELGAVQDQGGHAFVGHFEGFEPHVGMSLVIRLESADTGSQVALLHIAALTEDGTVEFELPGVVMPGQAYTAFWYVDLNRNGRYDEKGDHSATITTELNENGFVIGHQHHGNITWQE